MFDFHDLDEKTRACIVQALEEAEKSSNIYFSTRFNDEGRKQWITLLTKAAQTFDEHWLAFQLENGRLMTDFEGSRTLSGAYTTKHVPHTAAETFSEGQFNRFYILGLCKRARLARSSHEAFDADVFGPDERAVG